MEILASLKIFEDWSIADWSFALSFMFLLIMGGGPCFYVIWKYGPEVKKEASTTRSRYVIVNEDPNDCIECI